jgi:D-arginine dehydrogenase
MSDFDVIIVGGGIAGASLGAAIAGQRRTLILEAEDQCGYHSTGRSAAFYLESYGGPEVAKLTAASGALLERGGYLHRRGALHLSQGDWPELPPGVDAHRIERAELERLLPGVRPAWIRALVEPGCADIDVAALHAAYLRRFAQAGGTLATRSRLVAGRRDGENWRIELADGAGLIAPIVVNAAGAWADLVAEACGVARLGLAPKRRTMVQLRVGRSGLKELPLVNDSAGQFYFKGEGDSSIWLSPHDEIPTDPCDAAPDEIDVATAIERFQGVVDWPVERVERKWAGLRTFAPDRLPVFGFDRAAPGFFWCAGQGGFGIQTSPAAASLCGTLLLENEADGQIGGIDAAVFSPARFGG